MRILLVLSCVIGLAVSPACAASDERLNFIFLLVDDWGWTDAGCFGSDLYQTPNIDRLAREGMKFTNGYAACTVCSPTRAAVMTGMYPGRTRVTDWIPGHGRSNAPLQIPKWTQRLEHRHVTIAEAMKASGYATLHVGKWHLTPRSDDPNVVGPYYPEKHGFDVNIAGNQWGAPGNYFWPFKRSKGSGLSARVANFPEGGKEGDYLTDTLTTEALKVIEGWRDKPFFVYWPYYNVHTPIQGKKEVAAKYKARIKAGMRHRNAVYAAMVESVDDSVGRIQSSLDRLGIADRTVIFLTGDNGGLDRRGNPTENKPLRAGKGSAYEGGVRVPLMIKWPGVTPAGSVSDEPVISVDYYPTILSLAGVTGDAKHNQRVDGLSLVPVLKDPEAKLDRDAIYWHYPHYHGGGSVPHSAVRARDWRLLEFHHDMRVELYNLREDVGEAKDLAASNTAKADQLRKKLHAWRASVKAQMPTAKAERDAAGPGKKKAKKAAGKS
ncbi:MAG: sulfatase [Phycisphaerae bacterium]|nr:sulfatase [Phycisphaerae bacterium]